MYNVWYFYSVGGEQELFELNAGRALVQKPGPHKIEMSLYYDLSLLANCFQGWCHCSDWGEDTVCPAHFLKNQFPFSSIDFARKV